MVEVDTCLRQQLRQWSGEAGGDKKSRRAQEGFAIDGGHLEVYSMVDRKARACLVKSLEKNEKDKRLWRANKGKRMV